MNLNVQFTESKQTFNPAFAGAMNISDGGYERGYEAGYATGYSEGETAGRADGVEQGKQAEYDAFWDVFQNYGAPMHYHFAFSRKKWTDENYNPKYPIVCSTESSEAGRSLFDTNTVITDTKVPITVLGSSANRMFGSANELVTVRELNVHEGVGFTNTFQGCYNLKNLTISGTVGQSVDLHYSQQLTKASILSVMEALSTTASGQSVSFYAKAVDGGFETSPGAKDGSTSAEWTALVATRPNWTISLS